MAEKREGRVYVEQAALDYETARALKEEAERREVSRSHVLREAAEAYLGISGERRWEPVRRDRAGENCGRR